MKVAEVFILICIAALLTTAKADGTCESFDYNDWGRPLGLLKNCDMSSTAIDSKDFSVTSDHDYSVKGFYAFGNKNLEHLPKNLGAKFAGLLGLYAGWCSIKEVSRDNFQGLGKLRQLNLHGNQIEKIDDYTFEHIPAVEIIYLTANKIKKLNGHAFALLHKLKLVDLVSNECINEYFDRATRIADMSRVVTGKCGYTESEPSPMKNVKSEADLMAQPETSSAKNSGGGGSW